MKNKKYSLGIDFGTESGRAVLVEVDTGNEVATSVYYYKDGVIDRFLPGSNIQLKPDWALQNPQDYLDVIKYAIPDVLKKGYVNPEDVIGIGIDFTSCTMMPVDKNGIPLCMLDEYRNNPHSWVKLWKHHVAQYEADRLNSVAKQRGESFLEIYGGKISSEWLFPKIMEILDEAPEIYNAADRFIEGADWIVLKMTGSEKRNSCSAGYKAIWQKGIGYPSKDFFRALDPRLEKVVEEKLRSDIYPPGEKAGGLTKEMAEITQLKKGTPVSVGNVDAHVCVPASTIAEEGKMLMIVGTSICHMILGKEKKIVEGISGVVEDGIIPGYYGYEAGQAGAGDILAWFVRNCVPSFYENEAKEKGVDLYSLLQEKASNLRAGQSGLLALDWWNGNRSILVDGDLTGLLIGATIGTKPEEIYHALIESIAFGTNIIIDAFEKKGVEVKELYACGGLAEKNSLLMQIFSDVTGRKIKMAKSSETSALGAAMFGAVAAGKENGGYESIFEAAEKMAGLKDTVYVPDKENHRMYKRLFKEYSKLYNYFGRGRNNVMKFLKKLKSGVI
ncbi:MAG: ribulokinase [Acidobacteriota bacterium]